MFFYVSIHLSPQLIQSGLPRTQFSLVAVRLRGQLLADSRIIMVSFPVGVKSRGQTKGNKGEISLSRLWSGSGQPTWGPAWTPLYEHFIAKMKQMLVLISTFSNSRGRHSLFFSNGHPSAHDVPAVSLYLITAVKKEKGFLSQHFKEKLLLLLVYSRIVSLNCQSGCQIISYHFSLWESPAFGGFLMVNSRSIYIAQTHRWGI